MISVLIVVDNDKDLRRIDNMELNIEPYWTTVDERTDPKTAYKLKAYYAARLTPFAYVDINGQFDSIFYSEADDDVISSLEKRLNYVGQNRNA